MFVFVCNTQGDSFKEPDAKTVFQLIFPVSAHCLAKVGSSASARSPKLAPRTRGQGTNYPNEQALCRNSAYRELIQVDRFIGALSLTDLLAIVDNRRQLPAVSLRPRSLECSGMTLNEGGHLDIKGVGRELTLKQTLPDFLTAVGEVVINWYASLILDGYDVCSGHRVDWRHPHPLFYRSTSHASC